MDIAGEKFNIIKFISSPNGRLNRFPFLIAILIQLIFFLLYAIFASYLLHSSIKNLSEQERNVLARKIIAECGLTDNGREFPPSTSLKEIILYVRTMVETAPPEQWPLMSAQEECVNVALIGGPGRNLIFLIPAFLGFLAMICPTIRRLHDRGKSGWWYLGFILAGLIPFVGIVASIWLLVETIFLRGTVGPNDYGPDSLDERIV